jgi:antagonist of KipI
MSVTIVKQGLLDTIQDEGRFGFQHLGINPGGAMDLVAFAVSNILAGNQRNAPVLELHFPASTFNFQQDCLIALSGADFSATINSQNIPINTSIFVSKDSILKFGHINKGSRCYLAVHGGWEVDLWLNSYSTNLKAATGGYRGRSLKKDDVLKIKNGNLKIENISTEVTLITKIKADTSLFYKTTNPLNILAGIEYDWLSNYAKNKLQSSSYQISLQSDRMGYRLKGEALQAVKEEPLLSSAVTRGTIQLLPSGQLIILMADHQTTGGYPKIAHVISADVATLAQMHSNDSLHFKLTDLHYAEDALVHQQQYLLQLEEQIKIQLQQYFNLVRSLIIPFKKHNSNYGINRR